MKRPEFTSEQENWLCGIIGDWYLDWKARIADGQHRLGIAKEELKQLICGKSKMELGCEGLMYNSLPVKEFMDYYAHWKCMVCSEKRPDKFISVISHSDSEGIGTINVKYCNDKQSCTLDALNKKNWLRFLGE